MAGNPTRKSPISPVPTADGFVVHREDAKTAVWLNRTAMLVLELSTGHNRADQIVAAVADAFELNEPPTDSVHRCLDQLLAAGLITRATTGLDRTARGVLIHVDSPDGRLDASLSTTLMELAGLGAGEGVAVEVSISADPNARRAHNQVANAVLDRTDISHLFLVRSSTPIEADQFWRALTSGLDVVSLAPPHGQTQWDKAAAISLRVPRLTGAELKAAASTYEVVFAKTGKGRIPQDGYVRADTVATNGLFVSRAALLQLTQSPHTPEYRRTWSEHGARDEVGSGFFDPALTEDGESVDEDVAFCARWRALDGDIWVDLSGQFGRSVALTQRARRGE